MKDFALAYSLMKRKKAQPELEHETPHEQEEHEEVMPHGKRDLVDRVMEKHFSKGGVVANDGEDDLDEMADGRDNEFDVMPIEDELEDHETGANSGDELGDKEQDKDRHDPVMRAMVKYKKQRNPRPA